MSDLRETAQKVAESVFRLTGESVSVGGPLEVEYPKILRALQYAEENICPCRRKRPLLDSNQELTD